MKGSRPGTFERVYFAIKERLREGAFQPGDRLEPAVLADELNASVTPVRDALHRLTGERLVETLRHNGFRAPMLTETMLRHLYRWHLDLLLLALMHRNLRHDLEAGGPALERDAAGEPQAQLFLDLVQSTGNPEHLAAFAALSDRLEPVHRFETLFLDATEAETCEIIAAIQSDDSKRLRRSLLKYHRRRERIVPQLLAHLQSASTAESRAR